MRIGVVGAGGVGGYFAHRWAESGRDVLLIARGRQQQAIHAGGLRVVSPLGDATVSIRSTDDFAELAGVDLVVFATKTWQLPGALEAAAPHLREDAVLVGLQNGVESSDLLGKSHPPQNVLGGTCRIISQVEEPGVIRHVGVTPTITIGELGGGFSARIEDIRRVLDVGPKAVAEPSDDIVGALWWKFLFIAPVSGIGSVTRSPMGEFRSIPRTREFLHAAVREVAELGRALGVGLRPNASDEAIDFIDQLPPEGTSSMQRDFEAGSRTELEALSGYVSRLGTKLGVPTPAHDFIYASLLPLELKAREASV